jgi:phospho-N-acetylmuramoyl-pentapeptide-transferase
MVQLLGLVLISFFVTSVLMVPFIDLLFSLRNRFKKKITTTADEYNPLYNKLMHGKDEFTPVGGGLLIIPVVVILSCLVLFVAKHELDKKILTLVATILLFGAIGFVDDIRKIFADFKDHIYPGLKGRWIILLQIAAALIVSYLLYSGLGLNNLFVPIFGNVVLGWVYIPVATFIIVSFANAYNVSDGLDGLSTGLLMICLIAFLALASTVFDTILAVFVGIWIGALIAFLYFNVWPARIYLGDAGAYGFGAALAVAGLLTGKILGLTVIGGLFIIIILSSMIQIFSKKYLHKKVFPIAPIHLYFRYLGWEEPKIVMRFWLAGAVFAVLGLWLALLSK